MGCVMCEGCYLTPKKRLEENPRLTIHVKCFLELIRTESEIKACLKLLKEYPGENQLILESLKRIDNFWKRTEQVQALRKKPQETIT
jgi:hypothetical protein